MSLNLSAYAECHRREDGVHRRPIESPNDRMFDVLFRNLSIFFGTHNQSSVAKWMATDK